MKRNIIAVNGEDNYKSFKNGASYVMPNVAYVRENGVIHHDSLHEYVDFELPSGTLWATCNLGAKSPLEYGKYYAWADPNGYREDQVGYNNDQKSFSDVYDDIWFNGDYSTYEKYFCCEYDGNGRTISVNNTRSGNNRSSLNFDPYEDLPDKKRFIEPADDGAMVDWGCQWMIPTQEQFQELLNYTSVSFLETDEGQYIICFHREVYNNDTDSNEERYIFLPAAGFAYNCSINDAENYGRYWTSSLDVEDGCDDYNNYQFDIAKNFWFQIEGEESSVNASNGRSTNWEDWDNINGDYGIDSAQRFYGFQIRPVRYRYKGLEMSENTN